MSEVKYYWPERKKGALIELTKVLEEAEKRVVMHKKDVASGVVVLETRQKRLKEALSQRDECRLALVAARKLDPEDMYDEDYD